MIIKIDTREKRLHALIKNAFDNGPHADAATDAPTHTLVSEMLPLGDIILCDNDGKERCIIERKSFSDLAASLIDGRYKEQSMRLQSCEISKHNVVYLIEGTLDAYRPRSARSPTPEALWGAMVSLSLIKGFSLFRSMNMVESADYVYHVARKLNTTQCDGAHTTGAPCEYASVVKRVKKDNITDENVQSIMLANIPGISAKVGQALINEYGSIKKLIEEVETNPARIAGLVIPVANGRVRRIPASVGDSLKRYLCAEKMGGLEIK